MLINLAVLVIGLGIILLGAEIFTNGIEWLGKKLNLSEGAVGSILAAVGTALPETMIPLIAILFSTEKGHGGHEIGIGAILGAPFMLSTLAMFISGLAVIYNKKKRADFPRMRLNFIVMERDLSFFMVVYTVAIAAAFLPDYSMNIVIAFLIASYCYYVYLNLTDKTEGEEENLAPCYFYKKSSNPPLRVISFQIFIALSLIVIGANLFVNSIDFLAVFFNVPAFVLALIIAPIATELPEKFNSVIWISQGKDTLALGNITGAMVFQSSLIPAIGIALTDWNLTLGAVASAVLALLSSLVIFLQLKLKNNVTPYSLLAGGVFYLVFVILVFLGVIH